MAGIHFLAPRTCTGARLNIREIYRQDRMLTAAVDVISTGITALTFRPFSAKMDFYRAMGGWAALGLPRGGD